MIPTSEMVQAAIDAACAQTGESSKECAARTMGIRARHYAMHALIHVCGRPLKAYVAAELAGCPGMGHHFYRNSMNQTAGFKDGKRIASWWNEDAYGLTITAVEKVRPSGAVAEFQKPFTARRADRLHPSLRDAPNPVSERIARNRQLISDHATNRAAPSTSRKTAETAPKTVKPARPAPTTAVVTCHSITDSPETVAAVEALARAAIEAKRNVVNTAKATAHRPGFTTTVFRHAPTPSLDTDAINRNRDYERHAYTSPHGGGKIQNKRSLYDDLRRAVLNTPGSKPID